MVKNEGVLFVFGVCSYFHIYIHLKFNHAIRAHTSAIPGKEGSVLFNNTLNTFSYGYMASDIW